MLNFQFTISQKKLNNKCLGAILITALLFLAILSILSLSLISLVVSQHKLAAVKISQEYAFQIAEAGINYARWRLAHDPTNYASATKTLIDPEGGTVGTYQLTFLPPATGTSIIEVTSSGWYLDKVNYQRTLAVRYGKKAFTFYAFLFDSPVWFGGNNVDGRTHSNEGIKMNATGNSSITSAKATYTCTAIHDCNPATVKDGVWGTGGSQDLWDFPVSNIDFNRVTTDLAILGDLAENQGVGLFLTKSGHPKGYDLNFLANGTVEIYKVDSVKNPIKRWRWEDGSWKKYTISLDIDSETLESVYTVQANDLIFAETDLWIRGTVNGRVTVVSAKLPDVSASNTSIMLSDNIYYNDYDGNSVLGLIAQEHILISLEVPDDLNFDAVLMAQKGFIGRDYYPDNSDTIPYNIRDSITIYGSMISKDFSDPEFRWVNSAGDTVGGFRNNYNSYDPYLAYNPPPYFPLMGEYEFLSWEEKEKGE